MLQFLVFLLAVLSAVRHRATLLRAGIAKAGHDLRLGAHAAPPAIISVFLGETLAKTLDAIERGETLGGLAAGRLSLGSSRLPEIARDSTDRNRTAPFAFTGNKFEFRAVSSGPSVATPVAYLNAAVAESLRCLAEDIEAEMRAGKGLYEAATAAVRKAVVATRAVRFEGNKYSEEWVLEAERRGAAEPAHHSRDARGAAGARYQEVPRPPRDPLRSRDRGSLPREPRTLREGRRDRARGDEPARGAPRGAGGAAPARFARVGGGGPFAKLALARLDGLLDQLSSRGKAMAASARQAEHTAPRARADALAREPLPAMQRLREACDQLEEIVADEFRRLPKYSEMLFLV